MGYVKDAFDKVKQDINFISKELNNLRTELDQIRESLIKTIEFIGQIEQRNSINLNDLNKKIDRLIDKIPLDSPTDRYINRANSTDFPTDNLSLGGLNSQNMGISIGNGGVPTDRQTDRQIDRHIQKNIQNKENLIDDATEMIKSLDSIKKEIRLKFKRLTEQEFLVFSTLYQLDEEVGYSDYKTISNKLNLTESSIRDYIGRLMRKGIPVEKNKINNKNIQLSISKNFKKITNLPSILQLRDL
jgi:hypothetical protein